MNKNEKKLLSKGEILYFEDEVSGKKFKVSAEPVSAELNEKLKESEDSKKFEEEKKMENKKEEVQEEKIPEGTFDEVVEAESEVVETEAEISEEDFEEFPEEEFPEEDHFYDLPEDEPATPPRSPRRSLRPPRPPREPDPCPGVSAREHWPMLRNRWFVVLIVLVIIGIGVLAWYLGNNMGTSNTVVAVPKVAIATEVTTASRVMPVEVIYYTGVDDNWMSSKEYEFDFNENSPILWIYRQAGILYYDVDCLNKVPFSPENDGIIRNANSTLGPVTLSEAGNSWIVDETGEEVVFFSGYNTALDATSGGFTEAVAEKKTSEPVNEVSSLPIQSQARVSIPEYSEVILYYNMGSDWSFMPASEWDGNTSSFEYWNFGTSTNSMRYWDVDLSDPVPSDNPGNYFWGQDGKKCWNGSSIEPL